MESDTKQLLTKLEENNRLLSTQVKFVKILALLMAVLLVGTLLFMAMTWARVRDVSDALESVDWNALARKLSSLDVDGINDTITSMQKAAEAMESVGGRLSSLFGG